MVQVSEDVLRHGAEVTLHTSSSLPNNARSLSAISPNVVHICHELLLALADAQRPHTASVSNTLRGSSLSCRVLLNLLLLLLL